MNAKFIIAKKKATEFRCFFNKLKPRPHHWSSRRGGSLGLQIQNKTLFDKIQEFFIYFDTLKFELVTTY